MSKDDKKKGYVKARNISITKREKVKVEFHASSKRVAIYPQTRERDTIFDVNNILRFKEN